jgi:hypothetical protein
MLIAMGASHSGSAHASIWMPVAEAVKTSVGFGTDDARAVGVVKQQQQQQQLVGVAWPVQMQPGAGRAVGPKAIQYGLQSDSVTYGFVWNPALLVSFAQPEVELQFMSGGGSALCPHAPALILNLEYVLTEPHFT